MYSVILHSINLIVKENDNNKMNVLLLFFLYLILLFFSCIGLFQRRMPTNAFIIYFSIKG